MSDKEHSKEVTNKSFREQFRMAIILGHYDFKEDCPNVCNNSERWGNICCLNCRYLSRCLKKWTSNGVCYVLKKKGKRGIKQLKWCPILEKFYNKYYRSEKENEKKKKSSVFKSPSK